MHPDDFEIYQFNFLYHYVGSAVRPNISFYTIVSPNTAKHHVPRQQQLGLIFTLHYFARHVHKVLFHACPRTLTFPLDSKLHCVSRSRALAGMICLFRFN